MGFYDFAVELKKQHKESKDCRVEDVGYSLKYIPYILQETALIYNKHHKRYDFNELLSVAFTASIEAESKYNPDVAAFTTYARWFIIGALNTYVSSMSKTQLKLQSKVQNYIAEYYKIHNLYPSRIVILQDLKISEESFRNLVNTTSELQYMDDEEDELISAEQGPEDTIMCDDVLKAIDYIDVDYGGIIRMHLIDEVPFILIAKRLKTTKSSIQSTYVKGLAELRTELIHRGLR